MAAFELGSQSGTTYLLVLEQQQLAILYLESSLLEAGSLQQLRRLLTTPEDSNFDDVTLVGWTHRHTGEQVGTQIDDQTVRLSCHLQVRMLSPSPLGTFLTSR